MAAPVAWLFLGREPVGFGVRLAFNTAADAARHRGFNSPRRTATQCRVVTVKQFTVHFGMDTVTGHRVIFFG